MSSKTTLTGSAFPSDLTCLPRFGTVRNYDRKTIGPRIGEVAAKLGTPFMPWQQYVADVVGEVNPDTGLLWYREDDLLVPRRSGKTTLVMGRAAHRCLAFGPRQRVAYTAQTRNDARETWETEHLERLDHSAYRSLYTVDKTNGREAIKWRNGSRWGIQANTESAGHGHDLDHGFIDEAFKDIDWRREQAMGPAMLTRPQPQISVLSTAGTPASVYLWAKVEAGRARIEAGVESRIAYFEWSAADGLDPGDPATWWSCMPALGHTVSADIIAIEFERLPLPEFERAYLNRWNPLKRDSVVPAEHWQHPDVLVDLDNFGFDGPLFYSIDVNPERSAGAICVSDGIAGEVIAHAPGTDWLVNELAAILELNGRRPVVVDANGPASSLIPELRSLGVEVIEARTTDIARACGDWYDAVVQHQFMHFGQPELDMAIAGAVRRKLNDAWLLTRSNSHGDISPLYGVVLAHGGATGVVVNKNKTKRPGVAGVDPDEVARIRAQIEEEERHAIQALDPV